MTTKLAAAASHCYFVFCLLLLHIAILFVIVSLPGSANLLAMLLLIYLSYSRNISLAA